MHSWDRSARGASGYDAHIAIYYVHWVEQQVAKKRRKRDIFPEPTDPKFFMQWYLYDASRHDLHVKEAWGQGYTGKGIVVSILDDGIEKNHPDLQGNYDPAASYDVNDQDPDPQPRYTQLNDNSEQQIAAM
ncbi:unnamed protein product [Ranitomeya imitator]|uniref:Peptidase S8/S53 domain-containing protein n=1 Tax=Ranitomeya imitator TaxID=111125 RepID=A0ABN9MJQ2_9NEOB|nr:unnamed protein product [Ranitomeya imitator]